MAHPSSESSCTRHAKVEAGDSQALQVEHHPTGELVGETREAEAFVEPCSGLVDGVCHEKAECDGAAARELESQTESLRVRAADALLRHLIKTTEHLEILPCLENEDAQPPAVAPYKELFWKQFGGKPTG